MVIAFIYLFMFSVVTTMKKVVLTSTVTQIRVLLLVTSQEWYKDVRWMVQAPVAVPTPAMCTVRIQM